MFKRIFILSMFLVACSNGNSGSGGNAAAPVAPNNQDQHSTPNGQGSFNLELRSEVTHFENRRQEKTCYRDGSHQECRTEYQRECHTEYRNECHLERQCHTRQHCRPAPICRDERVCHDRQECYPNQVCRPLPGGGQTCRTESICRSVPDCHYERRCHDETVCRGEEECGLENVCRSVPFEDCRDVPRQVCRDVPDRIPYTCYENIRVPVKDFDTDARIVIQLVGLDPSITPEQLVAIKLVGEQLRVVKIDPRMKLDIQQQLLEQHMEGPVKVLSFQVLITKR